MDVILITGIILAFFQFVLLLNKRNKDVPDKMLALGMFTVGLHLMHYHLYYLGYWEIYPHLIAVTAPFPLLYGPVIYLYTQYSIRPERSLNTKSYLHFVPVVFSYLYMFKFYFFYSGEEKLKIVNGELDDYSLFTSILLVAFIVSGATYTILSYLKINKHKQLVDLNFSYDEQISLNWLKYSIWGIGIVFLTVATILILREGFGVVFSFNADFIFYVQIVILIFFIGFFGIQHQNIFSNANSSDQKQLIQPAITGEYRKSGLKQDVAEAIHKNLLQLMEREKPFLNPKLTLINLAELMDVSTNHLSQTINQCEKVNFHDFVNNYRIDEFIRRAKSNNNFSILANALDSGFNSKSSFNIVFKKFKGITPSKYMESLNK